MEYKRFTIGAVLVGLLLVTARGEQPSAEPGYVLLRDLAVLRGTVEEEPGRIIVRHQGSEIRLSREKVACWSDSLDGLYQYQLDRRRVFTMETHIDAARWCVRHGLHERAAAEIFAARRLQPEHPEVQRIAAELEIALQRATTADVRPEPQDSAQASDAAEPEAHQSSPDHSSAQLADAEQPTVGDSAGAASRLSPEEIREFTVRIQPLLANRCGNTACHGDGSSGSFVLRSHPLPGQRPSAEMTRENLESVLRWVSRQQPLASPLLVRALQPHGGIEEPPLGPRERVAIENLRQWILSLPHERAAALDATTPQLAARDEPRIEAARPASADATQPVRLPDVADPFDPELFNRRFHPERR